ncbi:hypothetical protein [Blastococcus sp. SYSU DS0533]
MPAHPGRHGLLPVVLGGPGELGLADGAGDLGGQPVAGDQQRAQAFDQLRPERPVEPFAGQVVQRRGQPGHRIGRTCRTHVRMLSPATDDYDTKTQVKSLSTGPLTA